MNSVEVIDITVFIIYILGICLFGISFYRSNKTSNKFITGGGKIPSWVVSFSIFATFVSSISYLGLPGSAFSSNWNAFAFSLSPITEMTCGDGPTQMMPSFLTFLAKEAFSDKKPYPG